MPVPRRFDRRPPERDTTRINDRIRVPEVRLVGEDGKQIGVIKTTDALAYAQERDLDLVEVAPEARPPVCRVLDYSKYKYEQAQKVKAARKHQQQITIREIKFRPKIAQNDYDTKKGHVERFLKSKDKVKVTIMFRGREVTHPERGVALLNKLAEELVDVAVVEQHPIQDGRNMTMMLGPSKSVLASEDEHHQEDEHHDKKPRRQQRAEGEHQPEDEAEAANGSAPKAETVTAPSPEVEAAEPEPAEPAPVEAEVEPVADAEPSPTAEPAQVAVEEEPAPVAEPAAAKVKPAAKAKPATRAKSPAKATAGE